MPLARQGSPRPRSGQALRLDLSRALRATNSAQDDSAAYYNSLRSRVGWTVGLRGIIVSAVFVFVREFEIGFG